MTLYERFISASNGISNSDDRGRAEILAGALIAKACLLVSFIVLMYFSKAEFVLPFFVIFSFNGFFYLGSRTKYYKMAAIAVIADPISYTTFNAVFSVNVLNESPQIPIALAMGPVIASVVLTKRLTIGASILTLLTLILVMVQTNPSVQSFMREEAVAITFISMLSIITVSLRERAERELSHERAKVLQSSKLASLGEMASGVAHELNSPLAAISIIAELLEDEITEAEIDRKLVADQLKNVGAIADRMSKIIQSLKNVARESSDEPMQLLPIKSWIDETLSICRKRFESHGIELVVGSNYGEYSCSVRQIQMTQVLLNLLNNAFDAVKLAATKKVEIAIEHKNSDLLIYVIDSGPGVEEKFKSKLFSPFATTKDYGEGTGLGLSVSRGIVKAHGGGSPDHVPDEATRFRYPTETI